MRRDLHLLVRRLREIPGISDIALTTNGYFLEEQASDLIEAGLGRINVSLDSLDPDVFRTMVRREHLDRVWKGLERVEHSSLRPVKINAVIIRGVNDGEIEKFAGLARSRPFIIRFIEFMPIGADDGWTADQVVPAKEIIRRIEQLGVRLVPVEYHGSQPADRYRFEDGKGEIGFISSVSEPFCNHCNRVRITSEGRLRTCLFSIDETDLRALLRGGAPDAAIADSILLAVSKKEAGHLINRPGFVRPGRTMSQIGG